MLDDDVVLDDDDVVVDDVVVEFCESVWSWLLLLDWEEWLRTVGGVSIS